MIKYISSFSVGTLHSVVNCAFLQMLCSATEHCDIEVYATSSTIESLKQATGKNHNEIKFNCLWVNSRSGRFALLSRYLESAFHNISQLFKSKKGDTLIYNFNNVFSLGILNFLSRNIVKGRRVITICHGEMEYLVNADKHKQSYKKLMAWLTKSFFLRKKTSTLAPDFHFVVLGDIIISELKKIMPHDILERFHSIDHPIIKSEISESIKKSGNGKVNIGTVGILNQYKGSNTYLEVLKRFDKDNRFCFSIVGQVQSDMDKFRRLNVKMSTDPSSPLPDTEFVKMVNELDYILLLYPADSYRLIASGAMLDAIRFHKPLIGISTVYFKYIFEKFGPVGSLADDFNHLISVIESLPDTHVIKYDYDKILSQLTPEALTPRFSQILKDCGLKQ